MKTIYDISKKTGFAPSTVSKVLNNYKGVSPVTKEKILQAVEDLNYIPNANARNLMLKKSFLIGVLIHDGSDTVFNHFHYSGVLEGFKLYMEKRGYDIIFINNKIGDSDSSFYDYCRYRQVEGVLLGSTNKIYKDDVLKILNSSIPCVSVDQLYDNTTTVLSNNYDGAKKALEYLYFLNHREIAYVDVQECNAPIKDRLKAYKDFVKEKKLSDEYIINVDDFTYKSGEMACTKILNNGTTNIPKAIFCACDEIALGLIDSLSKSYIKVPDDVSVIGFDDIILSKYKDLTTISQNTLDIGKTAANKLLSLIENKDATNEHISLDTTLIVRNTCKKI